MAAPPEVVAKTLVPAEFDARLTVTLVGAVTGLPKPSWRWIVIGPSVAVLDAAPDTGADVIAEVAAAAEVTVNGALVAPVSAPPVARRVYPAPARSIERAPNVATPLASVAAVSVPDSVPPAGFVPIATVIDVPATGTALPDTSSTVTAMAGLIAAPAAVVDG